MAKIISVTNQKGGVGKTTTSINVAAALGLENYKVLIIDIDPQGNATTGFGIDKDKLNNTLYDVFKNKTLIHETIIYSVEKNIDIVPSNLKLSFIKKEFKESKEDITLILRSILEMVETNYDYIIIDCPPSLGFLNENALNASDSVLIPIQAEYFALEGVAQLFSNIRNIQQNFNPSLNIEGILLTMFDNRTKLSYEIQKEVKDYFNKQMYNYYIPRTVKFGECPSHGSSIFKYAPKNKGAIAYRNIAKEIIKRNDH